METQNGHSFVGAGGGATGPEEGQDGLAVEAVEAAARRGVPFCLLMTGGFGADELRESGALGVYDSIVELRKQIADTPLG